METKEPNKLAIASPFKTRDARQPLLVKDIQSLVEQNNYNNNYP